LMKDWKWVANYEFSSRGRIWVSWNPDFINYDIVAITNQAIHGRVTLHQSVKSCHISVIYEEHSFTRRQPLWEDLLHMSNLLQDSPWLVGGDFNALKDPSDRVGGSNNWIPYFDEFANCLAHSELEDLRYVGLRFTWSTSSGLARKMRKIDRVLVNSKWNMDFSFSEASFLNPGISDHSPMVVRVLNPVLKRRPFKYFDFWSKHPQFSSIVRQVWDSPIQGYSMYRLVSRLKVLKGRLKQLNREAFSNISARAEEAREALRLVQIDLQLHPLDSDLADLEKTRRRLFVDLRRDEESFYMQKSRIRWLQESDRNSRFFHLSVKKRQLRNRILSVTNNIGELITNAEMVPQVFVSFFSNLLAPHSSLSKPSLQEVKDYIRRPLSLHRVSSLSTLVLDDEIRDTLFSLPKGKAPGSDRFTVEFFKTN